MTTFVFSMLSGIVIVTLFCCLLVLSPSLKRAAAFRNSFGFSPPPKGRCGAKRRAYLNPLVQDTLCKLAEPVANIANAKRKEIKLARARNIPFDECRENDAILKETKEMRDKFVEAWTSAKHFSFEVREQYDYYSRFTPDSCKDNL